MTPRQPGCEWNHIGPCPYCERVDAVLSELEEYLVTWSSQVITNKGNKTLSYAKVMASDRSDAMDKAHPPANVACFVVAIKAGSALMRQTIYEVVGVNNDRLYNLREV